MKRYYHIFIFLSFPLLLNAQAPTIQWQKNYGGSLFDGASYILSTSNGYIVSAFSSSSDFDLDTNYGGVDAWLFKLDNVGNILWKKSYGGSNNDYFLSMKETGDGGFIIGGSSFSNDVDVVGNNGGEDFWIVKTDSLGIIEWQKNYGGSNNEELVSIQTTYDGGYIASGVTRSSDGDVSGYHPGGMGNDFWIIKMDSIGNLQWQKCLGGSGDDYGYEIKQTEDLGYIVVGVTSSLDGDVTPSHSSNNDFWVVKIDSLGMIQWEKTYGGPDFEIANSVIPTFDGGYIVVGQASSSIDDLTGNHGFKDCWILKIDSVGTIQWQKNYGGSSDDIAFSVVQNNDSTYNVLSNTNSNNYEVSGNHGGKDIWFMKLSSTGNLLWQKCYGGSLDDEAYFGLEPTVDGAFVLAGMSRSNDMDVLGNYGNRDCWVVKLNLPVGINETIKNNHNVKLYPNPSNGNITLEYELENNEKGVLTIFDIAGKLLQTYQLIENSKSILIDAQGLNAGMYLYEININGKKVQRDKLMIIK